MNELIIIRGLPGSGKSTMAEKFVAMGYTHCETDAFFMVNGEYKFDGNRLTEAHDWCFAAVVNALKSGNVVVSNTFSRIWEMQRYLDLPNPKAVLTCEGNYGNKHGVPEHAVERMRQRWERYS